MTAFEVWRNGIYSDLLVDSKEFWRYGTTEIKLTKTLALDLAYDKCVRKFRNLVQFQAGRHGPVTVQNTYDAMCRYIFLLTNIVSLTRYSFENLFIIL
jgi:hypothetical protein